MEVARLKCQRCNSTKVQKSVCQTCGCYQSTDVIKVGQQVIYNPTYGDITRIWSAYEFYSFYPGMEMTIKEKKQLDTGFKVVTVEEVSEGWFGPTDLCDPTIISEDKRQEIIENFKKMWYEEKFRCFYLRKGQKVIFKPGNLTKLWNQNNPQFNKLVEGNIYIVTNKIDRRFVFLNDIPVKIYWKDVKKVE